MDLTSSWVLLVVVVLGGCIALYADRLGRNLGKKRLKLGSLRPRKTAELIVIGAGMLTPILAILAIMAISAEARQWIVRGYNAVRDARTAVEARDRAIAKYDEALKKASALDIRLQDQETRLNRALKLSGQYEAQAKQSEARAKTAVGKVGALESRVTGLSKEVKSKQATLESVQKDLNGARQTLTEAQQKFKVAYADREAAYADVDRLNREITKLNANIDTGKGDLEKLKGELALKQEELKSAEVAKRQAVDALQVQLDRLNLDLEGAQQTLNQARAQVRELAQKWLFERLTFRIGEEVARLPVGRQLSQSEAVRAIDNVLLKARTLAEEQGAAANNEGLAADIFEADSNGVQVPTQLIRNRILRDLVGKAEERVLVARVPINTFANQFVPLEVVALPNPIVFKEGELLGETRVDSNLPVGRLFEAIGDLLRDQVRKKAEDRKMIPIGGKDDAYGSISPDVIFSLITSIQATGRTVRLQALAKDDTRAAGPLALDFRLR